MEIYEVNTVNGCGVDFTGWRYGPAVMNLRVLKARSLLTSAGKVISFRKWLFCSVVFIICDLGRGVWRMQ
jgi:hypothetical protein